MKFLQKISRLSFSSLKLRLVDEMNRFRFRHYKHEKEFDWKWHEKEFNRIALVNLLISRTGGMSSNYLEIGCEHNVLFDAVATLKKTGVDPVSGGTIRMKSDEFFSVNKQKFDVVFIDGLHEYQQVRRDAINALDCLNENGWIAFHDLLPSNWKEQHVPRISNNWTGDCWKLAVELGRSSGLEFKIINIDHGVGLLRKTSSSWSIPDLSKDLGLAGFDKFVEVVDEFPICDFQDAANMIEK